jgi:hypothetical protein
MADTTMIAIPAGAVDLAHAAYLKDLIVAGRIADGQDPVHFPHARRLIFRAPDTNANPVFITSDPKSTAKGDKVLPDMSIEKVGGSGTNNQTILGWYVYGTVGEKLEVVEEY